LQTFG
jgi:hypothetical protein